MNIFKRMGAALGGAKPVDEMARAYPESALETRKDFSAYPAKTFLGAKCVFAYRLEFAVSEHDAARVIDAIAAAFPLSSRDTFQEGSAQGAGAAVHFSLRPEFGGAVAVIVTNSTSLLDNIDALALEPPPPWIAFPELDPSTVGSLQGSIEYWWDWLFLPFWSAADHDTRARYLARHPADQDWLDFLAAHAP